MHEDEPGSSKQQHTNINLDDERKKATKKPVNHDKWLQSVFKADGESSCEPESQRLRLQRVPQMLQDFKKNKKYFEPRVVSIGPYHHNNPKLQEMNDLKPEIAKHFFGGSREQFCEAYKALEKEVQVLKESYVEDSIHRYDNELFTRMMLEDGCFVLNFIDDSKGNDHVDLKSHHRAFVKQDLFLLENQIPFRVLEFLVKVKFESQPQSTTQSQSESQPETEPDLQSPYDRLMKIVEDFIRKNNNIMTVHLDDKRIEPGQHTHLLELLWKWLLNGQRIEAKSGRGQQGFLFELYGTAKNYIDYVMWRFNFKRKPTRGRYSFRNVKELTAAGIYVKPSEMSCLTEISFSPYWMIFGHLKLPSITIDDSSGPKFMNLIAYEMCPDVTTNLEVTSFLCFLDSLIDHPEDVKELRSACVIHNMLGSDEEVARLFNKIGRDLVPNAETYSNVKGLIQDHYENTWKCWMTLWIHEHFSTPWSGIALGAAIYALILASLDTFQTKDCDTVCQRLKRIIH